jgi:hypothetical protein
MKGIGPPVLRDDGRPLRVARVMRSRRIVSPVGPPARGGIDVALLVVLAAFMVVGTIMLANVGSRGALRLYEGLSAKGEGPFREARSFLAYVRGEGRQELGFPPLKGQPRWPPRGDYAAPGEAHLTPPALCAAKALLEERFPEREWGEEAYLCSE